MQAHALDEEGKKIYAVDAEKGKNYLCIDCKNAVRRRGGDFIRDHFFHLQDNRSCHLSQKSETHFNLQQLLLELLPKGEVFLEERFESIGRIADVAWNRYRLVFEIQVSPITFEELKGRIDDYHSIGWTVIWILHTKNFFKGRASREELLLEPYPHYFANHSPKGIGTFFDVLWNGPFPPYQQEGIEFEHPLPNLSKEWRKEWPLHFKGDFLHKAKCGDYHPVCFTKPPFSFKRYVKGGWEQLLESIFRI